METAATETPESAPTERAPRSCAYAECGKSFTPARADARFCSPACRLKAHRSVKTTTATSSPAASTKPHKPRPGGHKPGGAERYQEALRQVEEIERQHAEEQTDKPKKIPVRYSEAVAELILSRLEAGETLLSICSTDDMPDESSVRAWAADPAHPFSPRYVRAREVGYAKMADELLHIADDSRNDWMERETKDGKTERVVDHEHIKRSQLRVDTRKWLLAKMLPKVFGDKLDVTSDNKPLQQVDASAALKALIDALPSLAPAALPAPTVLEAEAVEVEVKPADEPVAEEDPFGDEPAGAFS